MTEVQPPKEDYAAHNDEVRAIWDAYKARNPTRVPVILSSTPRSTSHLPAWNPDSITYQQVFEDPMMMLQRQVEHQVWVRHTVPQDSEMGLPSEGWYVDVNFENVYEAAWFGCQIVYAEDQIPDTVPLLGDENRRLLFDKGLPDPFGGFFAKAWDFYDRQSKAKEEGWTYLGIPLQTVWPCGMFTDGPMTIACNLRGATAFLSDLIEDDGYADELLAYITESTIERLKAFRQRLGVEVRPKGFGFADDAVQAISTGMYRERILPHHRRLVEQLSSGGPNSIHLCGNATRHFPTIVHELEVESFDTGFPVDHGRMRQELGPDVEILGGPSAPFLLTASPDGVRAETRRILDSGIMEGGRFVMREGNSLAPDTPIENLRAMVETTQRYGRYGG